jgi:hypothetical protein
MSAPIGVVSPHFKARRNAMMLRIHTITRASGIHFSDHLVRPSPQFFRKSNELSVAWTAMIILLSESYGTLGIRERRGYVIDEHRCMKFVEPPGLSTSESDASNTGERNPPVLRS